MNKKTFIEKIEINNKIITIQVECESRTHAGERKKFYQEKNVFNLIPEEFKNRVNLIERPEKEISNVNSPNFVNCGCWRFEIIQDKENEKLIEKPVKQPSRKPATRRRRTTKK